MARRQALAVGGIRDAEDMFALRPLPAERAGGYVPEVDLVFTDAAVVIPILHACESLAIGSEDALTHAQRQPEAVQLRAGVHLPDGDRAGDVPACGDEQLAVGADGDASDRMAHLDPA